VSEPSFPRLLWDAWNAYAHRAAAYQAEILLSAIYFLVLGPTIVGTRLLGVRLLDLDTRPRRSYWIERAAAEKSVAALERQF
jgi:hypothetical protein